MVDIINTATRVNLEDQDVQNYRQTFTGCMYQSNLNQKNIKFGSENNKNNKRALKRSDTPFETNALKQYLSPEIHPPTIQEENTPFQNSPEQIAQPLTAIKEATKSEVLKMEKYKTIKIENFSAFFAQEMVFNLFSQYGLIMSMKIVEQTVNLNNDMVYKSIFLEFYKYKGAINCKKCLSNCFLVANNLRISLTKYENITEIELFEEDCSGPIFEYSNEIYLQRFSFNTCMDSEASINMISAPSQYIKLENFDPLN